MRKIIALVMILLALVGGFLGGGYMHTQKQQEGKKELVTNEKDKDYSYTKFDKPLIIPIFKDNKAVAMLIAEIWFELEGNDTSHIFVKTPRLRDEFLQVFYLYASEGKLGEDILTPQIQAELRRDLTRVGRRLVGNALHAVLINDLQRQDIY